MMIPNSNLQAGGSINITTHTKYAGLLDHDPLKFLRERAALEALHDSAERPDAPKCHPQTREAIQDHIARWARDRSDTAKPVLWLTGAAGAGKSAIAQTLIERWKEEKLIVPNFFCWRTSPKRNKKTHIIPTLAFQLTKGPSAARTKIEEALMDDCIFESNLKSQVEALIVDPLEDILAKEQIVILVIDGLDEVRVDLPPRNGFLGQTYEEQQREFLEAMALACQKLPLLRILIASRPERQIRASFAQSPLVDLTLAVSLVNEPNVDTDINHYLKCKFAEIRQQHPGINPSWPTDEQISVLVKKSSGQFIYPSTAIKYISRGRRFPVKSLEDVLALQPTIKSRTEHPMAELDALYSLVLHSVDPESWDIVRFVLGLVCHSSIIRDLPRLMQVGFKPALTSEYLERFLFLSNGELSAHLTDLHSLLYVPGASSLPIHSLHATLSEYLNDQSRSGDLLIMNADIYTQCSLLLIKHIKSLQPISSENIGAQYGIYKTILSFIFHASLSADLMTELWDLLKAHIGEYSSNDILPPKLVSRTGVDRFILTGQSWECHSGELRILRYLLDCNIPTFEPSHSHRTAIDQRLKEFIVQFDPKDPIARQYVGHHSGMDGAEICDTVQNTAGIPDTAPKLQEKGSRFKIFHRFSGWRR